MKKPELTGLANISSPVLVGLLVLLGNSAGSAGETGGELQNGSIVWHWKLVDGKFRPARLEEKLNEITLYLTGECFQLLLDGDAIVKASDFKLDGAPEEQALNPEPDSPTLARRLPVRQLVVKLSNANRNLLAEWRAILREGATYIREELVLRAVHKDVLVKKIILLDETFPGRRPPAPLPPKPAVTEEEAWQHRHVR